MSERKFETGLEQQKPAIGREYSILDQNFWSPFAYYNLPHTLPAIQVEVSFMGESKLFFFGALGLLIAYLSPCAAHAQDKSLVAKFTFNSANALNEAGGAPAKTVGVTYGDDRFGNSRSACFLNGSVNSYINLGTDSVLKPSEGTISMWIKMISEVYSGDGYTANPFILTKNDQGDDFFEAYSIGYDLNNKRIGAASTLSSMNQVCAISTGPFELNEWHHVVMTYSDSSICLYLDGHPESCVTKNFRTHFLAGDSVMVGGSANKKNQRFFAGYVDDIAIYNKVLTPEAVARLFEEGDPNRNRNLFLGILSVVSIAGLLVLLLLRKFRKALEREKEKNKVQRQVFEMETRVLKAQMNPHFIFNSMNSIQQFILADDTENANTYLVKFARLLRKILESSTDEFISLDNEVDILHKYIEIESLRFESAFTYKIDVDTKLKMQETRIPHMLIQPFVENAIWHGLLMKENDKSLHIRFEYLNENAVMCVVDDNGAGRKPEKVAEEVVKKKSLGIQFTSHRLNLMQKEWGGDYGVKIVDKTNQAGSSDGTRILITIPILKN
jgi:hypothetical protein